MLKENGIELAGKTAIVSGAGNVAIYAIEKAYQLGAKPVTATDSTGWIYDPEGVDLEALKEIKEVKRGRLSEYTKYRPNAEYHEGKGVWSVKADIALPCATQNELQLEDAKALVVNGVIAVCRVLTCLPLWKLPSICRKMAFYSFPARQQTQAA